MTGEEPVDRDALIQRLSVNAARTELEQRRLLWRCGQEAWEPCERHRDAPAVIEIDPQAVVVGQDRSSRGGHAISLR